MSDERIKVVIDGDAKKLEAACVDAAASIKGVGAAAKDTSRDTDRMADSLEALDGFVARTNRNLTFTRNLMQAVRWPAMAAGVGMLVGEVASLAAGLGAVTAAAAPAAGAVEAYAAAGTTAVQVLGTVKLATNGVSDALKAQAAAHHTAGMTAAQQAAANKKLEQSMQSLPKSAREFVKALDQRRGLVGDLRKTAADGLFPGLTSGVDQAAKNIGPLKQVVGETADEMGRLADATGELLGSKGFGRDFERIGRTNVHLLDDLGHSTLDVVSGLRQIMVAARPFNEWLGDAIRKGADDFDRWAAAGRKSGETAEFFDKTRESLSQLLGITGNLIGALVNIGHAGYDTGQTLLTELEQVTQKWEDWTGSIEGQNELEQYFEDARPIVEETGRLLAAVTGAIFDLGNQPGAEKLLKQLRTELVPALQDLLANLSAGFGPAMIDALTQFVKLFSDISSADGGLTLTVRLIGKLADLVHDLIGSSDILKQTLSIGLTGFSLYKLLGIGAAIKGLPKIVEWLKKIRGASAEVAAVQAAGGVAGGAAGGAAGGTAGKVAAGAGGGAAGGILSKLKGPAAGLAGGAAGSVALFGGIKALSDATKGAMGPDIGLLQQVVGKFGTVEEGVAKLQAKIEKLQRSGDKGGLKKLAAQLRDIADANSMLTKGEHLRKYADQIDHLADTGKRTGDTLQHVTRDIANAFKLLDTRASASITDVRRTVAANTGIIKLRLGKDTDEGRAALAANFRDAADAVKRQMDRGVVETGKGTREINRLLKEGLKALGLSDKQAGAMVENGTLQPSSSRTPGQAGDNGRAGGGWIGSPGEAGVDAVPVMLGRGEAVLNRHQQVVVNHALGAAFGTDLDGVFDAVRTPHYMATGGIVGLGKSLQRDGYEVSENPAFGGVHPVHVKGSLHYSGNALDVNDDNAPGGEAPSLDRLAARLRAAGWHIIWRAPGHYDHLHVDTANGQGSGVGAIAKTIKTPKWNGPGGAVGQMGRQALKVDAKAANRILRAATATLGGEGEGSVGGGGADQAVVAAFRRAIRASGASPVEALALWEAGIVESGLRNLSYGDRDSVGALQQRPSAGWTGLTNPYKAALEFLSHAKAHRPWKGSAGTLAQAVQRSAFPGRYDGVAGRARQYMASGGKVGRVRGAKGKKALGTRKRKGGIPAQLRKMPIQPIKKAAWLDAVIGDKDTAYGQAIRRNDQTSEEPTHTGKIRDVSDADLAATFGADQVASWRGRIPDTEVTVVNTAGYTAPTGLFVGGIQQHVAELNEDRRLKADIRDLTIQEQGALTEALQTLVAGIAARRDQLRKTKHRLRENIDKAKAFKRHLKRVNDELDGVNKDLQKKGLSAGQRQKLFTKKRNLTVQQHALDVHLKELGYERSHTLEPTIAKLSGELTDTWVPARDSAFQSVHDIVATSLPNLDLDLGDIDNELNAWGVDAIAGGVRATNSSAGQGDGQLLELIKQQLEQAQKDNYLLSLQVPALRSLDGLVQGRVLGAYLHGTDYVPQTGMYLLHRGEQVVTAAGSPFGKDPGTPAAAVTPQVSVSVAIAQDGTARATVDGRDVPVSVTQGQRQRLFSVAPGSGR